MIAKCNDAEHSHQQQREIAGGVAPGYVQGNLAILLKDLAADFLRFCQANSKPCR